MEIEQIPYIVGIQKWGANGCGGAILSPNVILTAAHCVYDGPVEIYNILSGSPFRDKGTHHIIANKIMHPNYHPPFYIDDLALLTIFPPIDVIYSPNRVIGLHSGLLPPNAVGTLSGWGCTHILQ